jgi:hypothetical protein
MQHEGKGKVMGLMAKRSAFLAVLGLLASFVLSKAASAQAEPVTFHATIPLHIEVTSPCSGEQVEVVEDLLFVGHFSDVDPDGRTLQLLHSNAAGGTATGVTSGNTYRFVRSSVSRDDFSGAPFVSTFNVRQLFVGTGTGDSFTLVIHLLLVVDANDLVRATIQQVEMDCMFE